MPDLSLVAFRYIYWGHFNGTVVFMIVGMGHLLYDMDILKGLMLGHMLEINGLYSAYVPPCSTRFGFILSMEKVNSFFFQ